MRRQSKTPKIPGETAHSRKEASPPKHTPSLDDVAARVLLLDGSEPEELADVRNALFQVASDTQHPPMAQTMLLEAVEKLDAVIREPARDADTAVAEVGKLVEQAMAAQDSTDSGGLPPEADASLVEAFVEESREHLAAAETAILALETDPDDAEACNLVFRAFHTIKGTSAFLGFHAVSELAHRAESLLSRVRDREIRFSGPYAELALRALDVLKAYVSSVQGALAGKPLLKPDGYDELLEMLADSEGARLGPESDPLAASSATQLQGARGDGRDEMASAAVRAAPAKETRSTPTQPVADAWTRVRTDRLDRLVDTIGELVIAHSLVAGEAHLLQGTAPEVVSKLAHTGKVVRELQDLSISMRMVPLRSTFQKMARVVRDVARKLGKEVEFVTAGEEAELDRNMVELLSDPLVHMIRNAVDHGIEPPEVRKALGKPPAGVIRLSACHAAGNVLIELSDDGRGLDREKIMSAAVSRGLIDRECTLSDSELYNLIFEPGFSTADEVTAVSGRGVGMDVVKRNIEGVRGRIEVASTPGEGSTFRIRLPLTLAITDGMLVRVGAERYIIPTVNIQITFRPTPEHLYTVAGRGELVLLRGQLIPLVRLHQLFQVPEAIADPTQALLLILAVGERRCALLVDELLGQQQVVAKSLGTAFGLVPGVSGAAILGDGRVGLILDPAQIIALSRRQRAIGAARGAQEASAA